MIAHLLAVWEQGAMRPLAERSWLLLRTAVPSASDAELGGLTVGEADRHLLALRDATFGSRFDAVSRCPRCNESIELNFQSKDFPAAASAVQRVPRLLESGDVVIEYILPSVRDLALVSRASSLQEASRELLMGSVLSVRARNGDVIEPSSLQSSDISALSKALESDDPLACTRLELQCPACAHNWSTVFDVAGYLWAELESWARGILGEVHLLARAYGWSESEILALPTGRRQQYLEMVLA